MKKFLIFLIVSLVLPVSITAQSATCPSDVRAREPVACAELDRLLKEESEAQKEVDRLKGLGAGFTSDIAFLTAKINTAQANIKSKNNQIALLTKDIAIKQSKINVLDGRIVKGKQAIAAILRKTNDINSYSLLETVLSDKNLSEFFVDMDAYASTEEALGNLFAELRSVKALTETEKAALAKKREAEAVAKAAIETAKKQVEIANAEKKTLLAINNANKKTYEQVVADRQAKAAKIRAELFQLLDIKPIEFGDALRYAETASARTGVRPAFILAVLQYESKLGANVGRCNRPQDAKKWQDIMPGPLHYSNYLKNGKTCNGPNSPCSYRDDQSAFVRIMNSLSRSTEGTPLSCPIVGIPGWGGAMGPAQFIPTTWEMFQSKISQALNIGTPDPWNPEHAITAMALYLSELGAGTQDWTNERTAACKYNSGRTCYINGKAGPGLSYGVNVMAIAESIQRDKIDPLQNL
ncbi:MAG: Myosin II heavy chain [Parcubacteria group bacterium GW2011_GWA2_50_10b]|nr:MAG: Myosin II heavy chain [Parcubacteria group bacterium GW2011_GWA2_50_10b]